MEMGCSMPIALIVLIILKLEGVIHVPWTVALIPLWVMLFGIFVGIVFIALGVGMSLWFFRRFIKDRTR